MNFGNFLPDQDNFYWTWSGSQTNFLQSLDSLTESCVWLNLGLNCLPNDSKWMNDTNAWQQKTLSVAFLDFKGKTLWYCNNTGSVVVTIVITFIPIKMWPWPPCWPWPSEIIVQNKCQQFACIALVKEKTKQNKMEILLFWDICRKTRRSLLLVNVLQTV